MTVDIIISLTLAVFAALGWRSGLIRQVVRIVAAIAVFFLSPTIANLIRTSVWTQNSPAKPLIEAASLFIAGVLIYAVIAFSGWLALKAIRMTSDTLSNADRGGGAALSLVKGLIISYVVMSVAILLKVPLEKMDPEDKFHVQNSYVLKAVEAYNVILPWQFPEVGRMHDLIVVASLVHSDPALTKKLRNDAGVADVLRLEKVKSLATNDAVVSAARNDNYAITVADETVRTLLADTEFVTAMNNVEWEFLRNELEPELPAKAETSTMSPDVSPKTKTTAP